MQYLILLHYRPDEGPAEGTPAHDAEMKRWGELMDEMRAAGAMIAGSGVEPEAVTTVRRQGGEVAVTDGPYAETKEVMFSFLIIDVPDLDAATAWAAKMPSSDYGSTEVRPMVNYEQA